MLKWLSKQKGGVVVLEQCGTSGLLYLLEPNAGSICFALLW